MEIRTDASHGVSTGPGTRQVLDPRKLSPKLQGRERKCTRLRGPPRTCGVSRTKLAPHRGAGQLSQPLGPHPGTLNGAAHLPPPCTPRPPPLAGQPKPQHRLPDPETMEKGPRVCMAERGRGDARGKMDGPDADSAGQARAVWSSSRTGLAREARALAGGAGA